MPFPQRAFLTINSQLALHHVIFPLFSFLNELRIEALLTNRTGSNYLNEVIKKYLEYMVKQDNF